jgi:hypothetical protein
VASYWQHELDYARAQANDLANDVRRAQEDLEALKLRHRHWEERLVECTRNLGEPHLADTEENTDG